MNPSSITNLKRSSRLLMGLFAITFFYSFSAHAQALTPHYVSMIANSNAYYEYLPEGYDTSSQKYPLILSVHGMGSLGNGSVASLKKVANAGVCKQIKSKVLPSSFTVNGETFKFIVISPQFIDWPSPSDINSILNYVIANYKVDRSRIYLTGNSMGGGVTWAYVKNNSTYAKRIAAIVPVCGASSADFNECRMIAGAGVAVWATHNDGDPTVPVAYTNNHVAYINAAPAPVHPAKKTIFHSNVHDAWTRTYKPSFTEDGMNIYEWMLQYKRDEINTPVVLPPTNLAPIVNAGMDQVITLPLSTATLSGAASDADGSIASLAWTAVSGPSTPSFSAAGSATTAVASLVQGTYRFLLKATDNSGASSQDTLQVVVNSAPVIITPTPTPTPVTTTYPTKYIKVNVYGGANPYNNAEWNNWNVGSGEQTNLLSEALKYSDGSTSAVKALLSSSLNVGDNGTSYKGGMAPAEVLRYTSYSMQTRTLTISGLSTSKKYNLELYASRYSIGNSTIFTLNGVSQQIQVYDNFSNKGAYTNLVPNAQGQLIVTLKAGTYYSHFNGFTLTEQGSTTTTSATQMKVAQAEESKIAVDGAQVSLYPNPVGSELHLQLAGVVSGKVKVQVINLGGSVVKEVSMSKESGVAVQSVPVQNLAAGTYLVRLQAGSWTITKKIVKQ